MDNPRITTTRTVRTEGAPTRMGKMFAATVCVCATIVVIMVTVKTAMMLFG